MPGSFEFSQLELYAGADISEAFANSKVVLSDTTRPPGDASRRFLNSVAAITGSRLIPRRCTIVGQESESGDALSIEFFGSLRSIHSRARDIFGNSDFAVEKVRSLREHGPDMIITDHPWSNFWRNSSASIRVPKWIRQELPLGANWPETVAALPRNLRREIARYLRKFEYRVSLDERPTALMDYYTHLHLPYVQPRFGVDAMIVEKSRFLHEVRYTKRLNLLYNDRVVGASLIERSGDTLSIRRSSMKITAEALTGRSDVLDYFCLLLAQLLGCTILDFGQSRPHICDGALRYKSKWRTRIVPSGGSEPTMNISFVRPTAAVLAFLRRNYFIQLSEGDSYIRILYDRDSDADSISRLEKLTRGIGLTEVQIVSRRGNKLSELLEPWPDNFHVRPIDEAGEPIFRLMAQR